jgi:signal transduction histidine kinase
VGIDHFGEQLDSLHAISVEIASLRDLEKIYRRALAYCLALTESEVGFIGLLSDPPDYLDLVAVDGLVVFDLAFYQQFRRMPVRSSVFGVTLVEERSYISNEVDHDPHRVGPPHGHPRIRTFLGAPLNVGTTVIGMVGVANRREGYDAGHERLLSTFANQVAVAIDNARLYQAQREMIAGLRQLHARLDGAERDQLLGRERERIAAGLHDDIEQGLFTIGVRLGALLEGDLDPRLAEQIRAIRRLASVTDDKVREVVFALAVPGQEGTDLTSSLRSLLNETAQTTGLETNFVVTGTPTPGASRLQDALRALVKEALANVVRHAEARGVLVSVRYGIDRVDLVVQDDGVGASELVLRQFPDSLLHFGLRHMRESVIGLGGSFEVANGEEGGLTIRVSLPLRRLGGAAQWA